MSFSMCRAELEQLLVVAAQASTAAGEGGTRGGDDIKVGGKGVGPRDEGRYVCISLVCVLCAGQGGQYCGGRVSLLWRLDDPVHRPTVHPPGTV